MSHWEAPYVPPYPQQNQPAIGQYPGTAYAGQQYPGPQYADPAYGQQPYAQPSYGDPRFPNAQVETSHAEFTDEFESVLERISVHRSTIGCVTPCYNEEESIAGVLEGLHFHHGQ